MNKLEYIKKRVEEETGFADLSIKSRKRRLVVARCIYARLACDHTLVSLEKIGAQIGRKHDMVIHYRRLLPIHLRYEKDLERVFRNLDSEVRKVNCPDDVKAKIYQWVDDIPEKKYQEVLNQLKAIEI